MWIPSAQGAQHQENQQYLVIDGAQETAAGGFKIKADGRLVVVRFASGRPVGAWVVEGTTLAVDQRNVLSADQPVTVDIALEF
jgi:hypothetical protein